MKLRKLELFGFKSFYDKTAFEFSDGITGIVGPNGCGKSNIVDAIRWVLGEHAPSYLRSKALQDVIFAGSEAAGPLGMAEVALTFVNDEGLGPPGYESYAEIQIARRAYRDGESEFFINKIPCRLKDIAELFLDTGAGARGYAIIEQGKISNVVKARPEEKRLIVEEAAGVAKFRVRKKEAERKMETTRQNLARVRDIIEEVRRQLGSLERQVRKAERFKLLRDELRDLDARIAARRHADLTKAVESLQGDLGQSETELAALRAEIAARDAERETERVRQAEVAAALQEMRERHAVSRDDLTRLQLDWEGKGREADGLRERVRETETELVLLASGIEAQERELREAEETLDGRRLAADAARLRMEEAQAALERCRDEHQQARREADQAQCDLSVRVDHHSQAASSTASLRSRIEDASRNLDRLGGRFSEAVAQAARAEEELRDARAREEEERGRLADATRDVERSVARLSETVVALESLLDARRDVEGRFRAASSRNETLLRLYDGKEWASTGARAVLRHYAGGTSGNGDRGVLGLVGELVETDAPYEKAVEAVLGERMQSVVVRDHVEGLAAMRFLKDTGEGRGAFVPMTIRPREDAAAYAGEEGVIAPLLEVVSVAPVCGDLGRKLFGGALLVKDLDAALRLWNRNGVWNSYVTLDGEMVTADGVLVGGAQGEPGMGVLAVKREIREVEKEIGALARTAEDFSAQESAVRLAKAETEDRIAEGTRRREGVQAALAAVEQRRAGLEAAFGKAGETVDALAAEREYYAGEIRRMEEEFSDAARQARAIGEAKGQEEERVRRLAADLETAEGRMNDARADAHAAEVAWTQLDGEVRNDGRRREELSASLAEKGRNREEREGRKAVFEERIGVLAVEMEAQRRSIDAALGELAKAQERVDGLLAEHAVVSGRIAAMEGAIREARGRESSAAEVVSETKLSLQRLRMEIAGLDDQHFQKYGVRPEDLPAPEGAGEGPGTGGDLEAWDTRAREIRERMAGIGDVNMGALEESRELSDRHAFLAAQKEDLEKSLDDLARAIQKINRTTREKFSEAMDRINGKLQEVFPRLFNGGRAYLTLTDGENLLESGVELVAQLPGKKLLPLDSLSGGEKSMAAAALIFSIFLVKPSPFCFLDEADAALDDANIDRVNALIRSMSDRYQFLLITHNKRTMELADVLYGITMEKPGISKVVSVRFQD